MLTGTVNTGKGLLMKETYHTVLSCYLLHYLHGQLVIICCHISGGVNGSQLVLCGSNLIMLRLSKDPQLPQLCIKILHKGYYPGFDHSEIMIVQLLSLGRQCSEKGSSRIYKVRSLLK